GAGRPGTVAHMQLLDLERGLNRLPEREFAVLQLVGLYGTSKGEAASRLRVSERTVYNRFSAGLKWLTAYMNDTKDTAPLRDFSIALVPDPVHALTECVERYREVFQKIAKLAAADPELSDLRVKWLPTEDRCVPVLSGHISLSDTHLRLSDLIAVS